MNLDIEYINYLIFLTQFFIFPKYVQLSIYIISLRKVINRFDT